MSSETQWARTDIHQGFDVRGFPPALRPLGFTYLSAEAPAAAIDALWIDGEMVSVVGGFEADRRERATNLGRGRVGNFLYGDVPGTWVRALPGPDGEAGGFEPDPAALAELRATGACEMPTPWGTLTCTDGPDPAGVRVIRIRFSAGTGDRDIDGRRLPFAFEDAAGVAWTLEAQELTATIDGWAEVGGALVPASGSFVAENRCAGAGTERTESTTRRSAFRPLAPGEAAATLRAELGAIPRLTRVQDLARPRRVIGWKGAEAAGF